LRNFVAVYEGLDYWRATELAISWAGIVAVEADRRCRGEWGARAAVAIDSKLSSWVQGGMVEARI
jgi:hypothetical protein